jgi:hypothetical protein
MSTLAIIVIAVVAVIVLVFIGGLAATRRRAAAGAADYERHIAEADRALEQARASDRGWERGALEQAARVALREQWPDFVFDDLFLVLVDDRPGIHEDRAHFAAVGSGGEARVVLVREQTGWAPEAVERN